jgi:hypothetical protein
LNIKGWSAAALTPIVAFVALWPQVEPFADWLLKIFMLAIDRPLFQMGASSIVAGLALAAFIPHIPYIGKWQAGTTKGWTRFSAGLFTAGFFLLLTRPTTPPQWADCGTFAFVAGGCAAAGWTTFSGWFYKVVDKPESLK